MTTANESKLCVRVCVCVEPPYSAFSYLKDEPAAEISSRAMIVVPDAPVELDLAVVPAQTCFVGLPRSLVQRWGDASSLVLRLRWQGCEAHVGWGGSASATGALEVPASSRHLD